MQNHPLERLDENLQLRESLLPYCRLSPGQVWEDPIRGHRVGCLDASCASAIQTLMDGTEANLAIHDPPYNLVAFEERSVPGFIEWCRKWIKTSDLVLGKNSALYIWLGADQHKGFQPLPEFMLMMRDFHNFTSRSFITMRNQRGYGTQNNWMAIRQECLYYVKGQPSFTVQYTDIPKILRGYYKEVNGIKTENFERSKSESIRPGNVWVDIQQVFYRMTENVNGCYAQKPMKAIERLILASSKEHDLVIDFFGHSGTTLIAAEKNARTCYICDVDPIYAEIMIRRLERYRTTGEEGWQNSNPFVRELNGTAIPDRPILRCQYNPH